MNATTCNMIPSGGKSVTEVSYGRKLDAVLKHGKKPASYIILLTSKFFTRSLWVLSALTGERLIEDPWPPLSILRRSFIQGRENVGYDKVAYSNRGRRFLGFTDDSLTSTLGPRMRMQRGGCDPIAGPDG